MQIIFDFLFKNSDIVLINRIRFILILNKIIKYKYNFLLLHENIEVNYSIFIKCLLIYSFY